MLKKLMKYDLIWINKYMIYYFMISIFMALICRITNQHADTVMGVIIDKICSNIEIFCLISTGITCITRVWVRFKNNLYKDESYLTHTLPVTKTQLLNSKILAGIISILLTTIVIIISIAIVSLNTIQIDIIKSTMNNFFQTFGQTQGILIFIGLVFLVILEILFIMLSGMFGYIVGFKCNNAKLLRSVLVGIMSYDILSSLIIGIIFIFSMINPTYKVLFTSDVLDSNTLSMLVIIGLIMYSIYNLGYYLICRKLLNKGVNVD